MRWIVTYKDKVTGFYKTEFFYTFSQVIQFISDVSSKKFIIKFIEN